MATAATKAARRAKFQSVFSKIKDELIEHFAGEGMPQEAVKWYQDVRASISVYHALPVDFFENRTSSTMFLAVNSIVACLSLIPLRS